MRVCCIGEEENGGRDAVPKSGVEGGRGRGQRDVIREG